MGTIRAVKLSVLRCLPVVLALPLLFPLGIGAQEGIGKQIGVVSVSQVFKAYKKVSDIQKAAKRPLRQKASASKTGATRSSSEVKTR